MSDATARLDGIVAEPDARTDGPGGALAIVGWALAALAMLGLGLALAVARSRETLPHPENVFFRLVARHEPWHEAILLLAAVTLAVYGPRLRTDPVSITPRLPVRRIALAAAVLSAALGWLMLGGTPWSMDEVTAIFQAKLLAAGRAVGTVPVEWRPFARALKPVFVVLSGDGSRWTGSYTPGYSALRAPFELLGSGWLLNPLLAAVSVLAIHRVAATVWEGERRWAWTAAVLLAVTPQFLVTSATAYSMPAHLALNLVWLALYLRPTRATSAALGPVGALALSLHNPFPHALFVAPFLLRLVRERRWVLLAYLGLVYGATSLLLLGWLRMVGTLGTSAFAVPTAGPAVGAGGGLLDAFALPSGFHLFTMAVSATLLLTWHTPAAIVGWLVAVRHPRTVPPVIRDAALGVLLTVGLYTLFPLNQGHGWGFRYSYAVVGNLVLLGVAGLRTLARRAGDGRVARLVLASAALSLAVQLPLRAVQVRSVVGPFTRALADLRRQPADVVVVPTDSLWYGQDLVRNDPLLRDRPLLTRALSPAGLDSLRAAHPGLRVRTVAPDELTALGMERVVPRPEGSKFWDRPVSR